MIEEEEDHKLFHETVEPFLVSIRSGMVSPLFFLPVLETQEIS